jgi:nucleoside-diphosphate-sugar epimerase
MTTKRLLIIGGTGFIGRNLVIKSIELGYSVTVLSLNKPTQELIFNKVCYIQCDIKNYYDLQQKLTENSFDYVINLGGYVDHRSFLDGGIDVMESHFFGVLNILKIIDWKILKRFVQIGSSDEYGNSVAPQNEKIPGSAISPYSFGKLAVTQLLEMLYRTEKFPMVVIRLFLVYGPGQNSERFLPQIINGCLSGDDFPVSKGEQLRDFCYIDDIIRGILLTLENNEAIGEVINLGSGNPLSIKHVIKNIQKIVGKGNPDFGKYSYRVDENMELYADIQKANKILNWQPNVDINHGLKKTIAYFKEQS